MFRRSEGATSVHVRLIRPNRGPQDRRKLVAVLYADMVGYSRLIGLDDQGTLDRLRALRREVIDPAIGEHSGKVVQTGGDLLLIVFDSIDGAVRCAVKVQQQVPIHDGDQPPDRAIRFRVGINIGDAIADGTDLHGDAVNVAARIQAECPPGGICVTRSVRDHVHGRLGLDFEELGLLKLKNISRPIEAFVARIDSIATTTRVMERPSLLVMAFESPDLKQEFLQMALPRISPQSSRASSRSPHLPSSMPVQGDTTSSDRPMCARSPMNSECVTYCMERSDVVVNEYGSSPG